MSAPRRSGRWGFNEAGAIEPRKLLAPMQMIWAALAGFNEAGAIEPRKPRAQNIFNLLISTALQ